MAGGGSFFIGRKYIFLGVVSVGVVVGDEGCIWKLRGGFWGLSGRGWWY